VQYLVDQDIRAARKIDQRFAGCGVSREHDRSIRGVEPKREGWNHRRVLDQRSIYDHARIPIDETGLCDFVNPNQRIDVRAPFVLQTRSDIDVGKATKRSQHGAKRRRPEDVDAAIESGAPSELNQCPGVNVVIRMMVRYEDRTQAANVQTGQCDLTRDSVPAIDDVQRVVNDDDIGRRCTRTFRRRSARRPQEHDSGRH
jgi:hypothetical protein